MGNGNAFFLDALERRTDARYVAMRHEAGAVGFTGGEEAKHGPDATDLEDHACEGRAPHDRCPRTDDHRRPVRQLRFGAGTADERRQSGDPAECRRGESGEEHVRPAEVGAEQAQRNGQLDVAEAESAPGDDEDEEEEGAVGERPQHRPGERSGGAVERRDPRCWTLC